MAEITLEHRRTALLIADFYAEQMSKLEHARSRHCVEKTVAVREAARKAGLLIMYSATVFRDGYPEIGERNKIFVPRKKSGAPAVGDPIKLIHQALRPADNEIVIGKHRVNAMYGTDLSIVLRANNIHTLIMLGFATSGVILSTTRYAADEDYRIVIVEDCCADFEPEVHDFLCFKVLNRQAEVVQSTDLSKALA
ncbi:MAG: cysteine hydrolase [Betaproteobacteria bacterium]|nr:cysteine hydrolase [Betaproteobacteria bacterium]